MNETLAGALIGFGIFVFTEIIKLFKKKFPKISTRWIVLFLVLISGTIYYSVNRYAPNVMEDAIQFAAGAFGSSQVIWMMIEKYGPSIMNLLNDNGPLDENS